MEIGRISRNFSVEAGAIFLVQGSVGWTHRTTAAAANGHKRLINWFIERGIPVDIGTEIDEDVSPLYCGCRELRTERRPTVIAIGRRL